MTHPLPTTPTAQHLEEIPSLYAEAVATWGTAPVADDGDRRRAVPGSRTLADLDRLLIVARTPPRPYAARTLSAEDAALQQPAASVGSLFGWVRVHHDDETADGRVTWLPADDVESVCTWLGVRLEWARRQEWADEYAADVRLLWGQLRAVCRVRPAPRLSCPDCGERLDAMGDVLRCLTGHEHPGPARAVADYRRRPSLPTADICEEFGCSEDDLQNWRRRRGLTPDRSKGGKPLHWWPWDVLLAQRPYLARLLAEQAEETA